MSALPDQLNDITNRFGPHLAFSGGVRLETGVEPDKLVNTHCCFCGQQCGITLKVKDNQVIGFEPWEDFPFNKGMLCPKGVKRYLQGAHPDRLTTALQRDESAPGGFRSMPYQQAIDRVAAEIQRIQSTYSNDAFAVLTGASLTTEKAYLMGKFARVALKTANIDYNGRLCMVSAAAGNKKSFGIDRAANPWSDILGAEVVWISGANVAECAPITTNYVWQAREQGAKIIVVDPRITPIARTCDLFLPIKPGRDIALFNGILHLMIENDWFDHDFINNWTVGFDAVAEHVKNWTPKRTAEVTGVAERAIHRAAEWWGKAKTSFLMHARGIEHHSHGVQNVLGAINIVLASGRIGLENCGYATITGQGNGQGGVCWPCYSEDHAGTPRLFELGSWNVIAKGAGPFYFPDGKARFNVAPYTPPAEDVDEEYPLMLTTGRVVSQFLSGTQTRRIGPLVEQYPEPRIELHPRLAEKLGIKDGDWATAESRRGVITLRAQVVTTIRPDTIFIPYHWAGAKSANQLTISAQDPISKIPEYKVCAVRVKKAENASDLAERIIH